MPGAMRDVLITQIDSAKKQGEEYTERTFSKVLVLLLTELDNRLTSAIDSATKYCDFLVSFDELFCYHSMHGKH